MSNFSVTITGQLPNEPTDEQKEQANVAAGDYEAQRRLDNIVVQEHAADVTEATQDAVDLFAKQLEGVVSLVANGTCDGVVITGIQATPPSNRETRSAERSMSKDERKAAKREPEVQPMATTATAARK